MLPRRTLALLSVPVLLSLQLLAAPARKAAPKRSLAQQIKAILSQEPLTRAYWGIHVVDLATGRVLYSQNSDQLFLPASNAKLFTTAAALSFAGPEYRFQTTVETEGKIDGAGHLQGDLVIMGRGDPNVSGRVLPYALKTERAPPQTQVLEEMANQVAASGLKAVDGDLIGDDTFYAPERYGPGWAQDDVQWIDGAPVSALTFNDNVVFLNIQPGSREGETALITLDPETSYYEIDNRVLTTAAGVTRKIGIHRDAGSKKVVMWGSMPLGDSGIKEALAIDDPAQFTAELFRVMLERRGITIAGKTRARHGEIAQFFDLSSQPQLQQPQQSVPGVPPEAAAVGTSGARCCAQGTPAPPQAAPSTVVLAEHISLPLIEDVRVTNKTSQNLHAELALRLVSKLNGSGGSLEGGAAAVKQFLLQAGLKEDEFVLLDGSGLSRRDLVTPAAVVRLLTYAARQPWGTAYEGTLPVAAVDGSISERYVKSPAAGLVHAKTGTLSHVNALSGYGQTLRGKRFVFSIFCNNHNQPSAKVTAAIDSMVELLVSDGGATKTFR
jgi:D-alanyl-D-alanine carboxypeptidase/D-alanyl-D-alanine-endopeptidase (penicillin-binding protein 4)